MKLTLNDNVETFEKSLNAIVYELEGKAVEYGRYKASLGTHHLTRGRSDGSEYLLPFFVHVKALKRLIVLMREAEEIILDMADDPVEEAYARGELRSYKNSFIALHAEATASVEMWLHLETESGRSGNPALPRELFLALKSTGNAVFSANPANSSVGFLDKLKISYALPKPF